jgi:tetratricopeptide (TPR) repeat protein
VENLSLSPKARMGYVLSVLLLFAGKLNAVSATPKTPEQIFQQAVKDMSAGAYAQAEGEFKQVLREDPENPSVLINLGVLYVKMLRFTEAIDSYKKALQVVPRQEAVQINLGLAYLKQGKYGDALPYFLHLHESHQDNAQFTTLLATCLTYTGRAGEAIQLLLQLTGPTSQDRGALYVIGLAYTRADKPKESVEAFTRVFAGAPEAEREFLFGEAYLDATDYPSAVQSFESTLSNNPNFAGARRELGRAYLGMHKNDLAEQELKLAIKADPNDASALYSLGALLVQLSRWSEGRTVLEQAQKVAPDSWATAFYLGKADLELKDTAEAEKQLRRSAELNPDEPGGSYLLARILRAQGNAAEADKWMQRVAALHATSLDAERRAMDSADRQSPQRQGALP